MTSNLTAFATSNAEWAHTGIDPLEVAYTSRSRKIFPTVSGFTLGFASFTAIGYFFDVTPAEYRSGFLLGSLASAGLGILIARRWEQGEDGLEEKNENHAPVQEAKASREQAATADTSMTAQARLGAAKGRPRPWW